MIDNDKKFAFDTIYLITDRLELKTQLENKMTQIYITPSADQLIEFTKENPLFLQEVKDQTNKLLLEKSSRYLASRLEQEAKKIIS